ncbi:hypothetical protein E4U52_003547 [Claviceps spartinae]|nr:hypothetical protein E4U52_003547 [Claviceps spartinae]
MDVLVLSWEDGHEDRPRPSDEDYKTLYEYAIAELNTTLRSKDRWATRFSAYDTLTLRHAQPASDAQLGHLATGSSLAGIISDVSTTLKDLRVLYRDPAAEKRTRRPPDLCREMGASGLRFAQGGRAEVGGSVAGGT